jgi:type IV pilus assembly protein PilB
VDDLQNVLQLQIAQQPRQPLGALLLADGALSAEQLEAGLVEAEQSGRRLGEILVARSWLSSEMLAYTLARQAQLPYLDLQQLQIDPAAASLLPEQFARRYRALPVSFVSEDCVLVAVADPTNVLASDDLRLALGLNVEIAVVESGSLDRAIDASHQAMAAAFEPVDEQPAPPSPTGQPLVLAEVQEGATTSAPAIKVVNSIIATAVKEGASDVHFEPQADEVVVRARIDGVMRKLTTVPKDQQAAVTSRLKIMGQLDIAEKRAPQDGRLTVKFDGQPTDVRIAVIPTIQGEQVVLRILQRRTGRLGLTDLGMAPEAQEVFTRAIQQPYGAVIVCGPTGSGKTTTLYAALDLMNDEQRVLMTIEDPVEYQTPGINQIEVNVKAGLTFARGLRTILRSDPDVLLVGEVRDDETAHIAIQAAMTGHLVLTTLHTHNAASSIERLKDMGVEPSLIANSINCIVAQRLARRLCVECREAYHASEPELQLLGLTAEQSPQLVLFRPRGCARCAGTGFRGRVALYEVMPVQGKLRRLIEASTEEIFAAAVEQGMATLRQDGMRLIIEGVSSVEEIRRVTGDRLV